MHDNRKATGPMSFATYMSLCLAHPTEGYYMNPTNPVFGSRGDFTTSPEISQVFGELIAIWLSSQWISVTPSRPIRLIELGPGRGTLMADMLRTLSQFPALKSALREVHLVETSPTMRAVQKEKLGSGPWSIVWHDSIEEIAKDSDAYTMLVANEFFDALPVHVIEKSAKDWREVLISASPDPTAPTIIKSADLSSTPQLALSKPTPSLASQPRLRRVLSSSPSPISQLLSASSPRFAKIPVGSRIEVSPVAYKIARKIGELLSVQGEPEPGAGGCALVVDYGGDRAYGNSFRAFKDHKIVDVFHRPGECDLTVNVDFAYLKEAVAVSAHGPILQASFLDRMGMRHRVDALKRSAHSEERKKDIEKAAQRLTDLTGMGKQYQVMGITSDGIAKGGLDDGDGAEREKHEVWPFMDPRAPPSSS
ncbi:hypothetical protein PLICRDRAFT_116521 [Plicaturopsis crispa FD-325 SS-3]|uniref:Protein arginine methyltransferase NDUFAF7 n=1 Tax=Plicaturopsis crispa FD-325 SS-3 TaxID=944288 RepID=A0A0C9T9Z6_PLICR|nr:hypothetical protein PLICRDRAFT_116521 [Plicaturopsis crispa FD-325 SS-3]